MCTRGLLLLCFPPFLASAQVNVAVDLLSEGEGQLPPVSSIVCVDVLVDVATTDVWTASGLHGETLAGVTLIYAHDPDSGDVILTNPGVEHRFTTFFSKPRGRDAAARFTNGRASFAGPYCELSPNPPTATDSEIDIAWFANPPETPNSLSADGAIFRVALDVSATAVPAQFFQVFTGEVAPPGTTVVFRSVCSESHPGLVSATFDVPGLTGLNWGVAYTPPPLRACCLPNGTCQDLREIDCVATGGTPNAAGLTCAQSAPTIQQQPSSLTTLAGETAGLTVAAVGEPPFTFQWYKAGVPLVDGGRIAGSTNATLSINPVQPSDAGAYHVTITHACVAVTSNVATLGVTPNCSPDSLLPILLISSRVTNSVIAYRGVTGDLPLTIADSQDGLDFPNSLAVDGNGHVFVGNVGTNSILEFDIRTGNRLRQFSDPFLNAPDGLLLHPAANPTSILVSSFARNSVEQFSLATGLWMQTFVPPGAGEPGGAPLSGPAGLAHAANGDVLVASQGTHKVFRYDAVTRAYAGTAAQGNGLIAPEKMLLDPLGNLLVASFSSGQVLRFAPNGTFLGVFVASGSGGLTNPGDLAWAPSGNLLVSDRFGSVMQYNGQTGAFVSVFVASGSGGLNQPTDIAFAYLCDTDCNANAQLDQWDLRPGGPSRDVNHNGTPDECEDCLGDLTGDDLVGLDDLAILLSHFGTASGARYEDGDISGDGAVSLQDLADLLAVFGRDCN